MITITLPARNRTIDTTWAFFKQVKCDKREQITSEPALAEMLT